MTWIDCVFFAMPVLLISAAVCYSHRFTHSVADFISGGRCAGRYLLAVASNTGAIVYVALFEMISKSGFVLNWWGYVPPIVLLLVGIYGFVTYRMRETRALTLAQFFEIRYDKSFRVFAGILGALSGLLCDGIIAAVEARFFVYFLGLPEKMTLCSFAIDSYIPLMGIFLIASTLISLYGGFVATMLIDCMEGIISQLFYLLLIFTLLRMFSWNHITTALGTRPPGESLFNPFDAFKVQDFNVWFNIMTLFVTVYVTGAWRNSNGYATAPLNAHEGRMGVLLGKWRETGKSEVILLLAICGMTFLAHPAFSDQAHAVNLKVSQISGHEIQEQMRIPVAIAHFLPVYIKDALCAVLLLAMASGTCGRTQSWASIVIQDVIVPLRKKAIPTAQHLFMLKASIIGVSLFFFLFGTFFRQTQYIIMWFSVTGAIYIGGAGSVIIGGLYWKKGTTAAALVSLIMGSGLAVGGILAEQFLPAFPLNGVQVSFYASLISIASYIIVSLLTCREDFDMDRMLHRGQYATLKKQTGEEIAEHRTRSFLLRAIGIDKDFSTGDKWIACGLFGWIMLWIVIFAVGTVWNVIAPWPLSAWWSYWHVTAITIPVVITVVTTVWFTWGGTRDIIRLFRRLKHEKPNVLDNGTVVGHRNADEVDLEPKIAEATSKYPTGSAS